MSERKSRPAIWSLAAGMDRRFRGGHPWVYSNELQGSPAGLEPGAPVELRDASGRFLARGFGNPSSLIAFRSLSRDPAETDPWGVDALALRLERSRDLRAWLGLSETSHRWVFGEADGLPGLVVDRYRLGSGDAQVLAVQAHSAGADRMLPTLLEALERACGSEWRRSAVIVRNDVGVRKLEGLAEEPQRVIQEAPGVVLGDTRIRVAGEGAEFRVDLLEGQKTGFFLDQTANVALAARSFMACRSAGPKVRVLDLFSYVGQWGAGLARACRAKGSPVEVTAVDSSAAALELARANIEATGATCETLRGDALKCLGDLPARSFDVVVCDPPALIKGRKHAGPGAHAYLQLNTEVLRLVKPGGAVVSCSCSALLEEDELCRILGKAAARNGVVARWVARGGQAPDHPVLAEFPEGRYLKAWLGFADPWPAGVSRRRDES